MQLNSDEIQQILPLSPGHLVLELNQPVFLARLHFLEELFAGMHVVLVYAVHDCLLVNEVKQGNNLRE